MRKARVFGIFALLAGVALRGAAAEDLVFCRPNNMVSALAYVAEARQFFEREKLSIRFETASNFKICEDMLVAGKADISNGGDGPFVYLAGNNPPFKLLAFIGKSPETSVFARSDRGIRAFSDLKGHRVAYLPGTVSAFFLASVLKKSGLWLSDLSLVPMQTPTMTQALVGGTVDAIVTWEPWGAQALLQLGERGIQLEDPEEWFRELLVASDRLIRDDPAAVRALIRAFLEAETYINEHPDEARRLLAQKISLPEEVLARYWPRYSHRLEIDAGSLARLNGRFALLQAMDRNFARSPSPDFPALIHASFLRAIMPDRVEEGL